MERKEGGLGNGFYRAKGAVEGGTHAAITPSVTAGLHDTLLMASFTRVFKEKMKTAMKAIAGF
jgi:hypothetical protein